MMLKFQFKGFKKQWKVEAKSFKFLYIPNVYRKLIIDSDQHDLLK